MRKPRRRPLPRTTVPRQSQRNWLGRSCLALGAVTLGTLSVGGSFARAIESADPARAAALAPGNGVVLAARAQQEFMMAPSDDNNALSARLARLALRADPTAVDAINVLGLQAQLRNETGGARELFQYSLLLSRRELRPQLWAIEEAVNRGDIKGALRSYDIALRTSKEAPNLLLPNLAGALAEPKIRAALLPILATGPGWTDSFLKRVATNGIDPESGVAFFREAAAAGLDISDDLHAGLVNSLANEGKHDQAWRYYAAFRRGAVPYKSRDPEFRINPEVRAVFDWIPTTQAGFSAAILQGTEGGVLDFSLPPGTGGMLVRQTQMLPVGAYRLEGRSLGIDLPDRSRPYWILSCHDGRELGRVEVTNSKISGGRFEGIMTVPADCRVQTLSLVARTTDAISGVSGQIERTALLPTGDRP